jgi:hypothetical protein
VIKVWLESDDGNSVVNLDHVAALKVVAEGPFDVAEGWRVVAVLAGFEGSEVTLRDAFATAQEARTEMQRQLLRASAHLMEGQ